VRKGVTGLADDFKMDNNALSRNAYLWDRV